MAIEITSTEVKSTLDSINIRSKKLADRVEAAKEIRANGINPNEMLRSIDEIQKSINTIKSTIVNSLPQG